VTVTRACRRLAIAVLVLGVGCGGAPPPLADTMVVEDVVRDLAGEVAALPRTLVDPGDALRGDGARTGMVMAPGNAARLRVAVPAHAALRFGIGVAGDKVRDRGRAGVRFAVAVDGAPRFTRIVNPARDRHDRRWFDERVDLAAETGKTVDVTLTVEADAPDLPLAGEAAWTRLRVVQTTEVARQPEAPDRPNLLVLLVDTLRADAVGLYGGDRATTPVLDALGARGTVFATAVSQSPWTLPSVATLMTGLPPRQHRAVGDSERAGRRGHARWGHLADGVTTWAELGAHAGISTFAASANPLVSAGTNLAQGFETFVELPWDPDGRNWATADEVNAAFLDWLPRRRGKRFAAYLHYMEPHDPYTPPSAALPPAGIRPQIAAGWVRDAADAVNWGSGVPLSATEIDHLRRRYTGEVAAWDQAFGRLLAALATQRVADDMIIVVTADHGEEFQEHGRLTHGSHLYEESIRVPLVVAGPGVPVGRRDELVQGIDLLPTLARVLGTAAASLPGRDLFAHETSERPAFVETTGGIAPDGGPVELVAVRTARWKLIHTPSLARTELYDLATDPRERIDGSAAADVRTTLLADLERWRAATSSAVATGAADPAFAARLRALGYAE
jgi:arylsulfatase A-like enzyme